MGSPRRILDLPSVDIPLCQLLDLLVTKIDSITHFLDKCRPDLLLRGLRERLEVQGNVDTAEERFVECLDAVGGEEENTTVVLDVAEADK